MIVKMCWDVNLLIPNCKKIKATVLYFWPTPYLIEIAKSKVYWVSLCKWNIDFLYSPFIFFFIFPFKLHDYIISFSQNKINPYNIISHVNDRKSSLLGKDTNFHLITGTKNPRIDFTKPRIDGTVKWYRIPTWRINTRFCCKNGWNSEIIFKVNCQIFNSRFFFSRWCGNTFGASVYCYLFWVLLQCVKTE